MSGVVSYRPCFSLPPSRNAHSYENYKFHRTACATFENLNKNCNLTNFAKISDFFFTARHKKINGRAWMQAGTPFLPEVLGGK